MDQTTGRVLKGKNYNTPMLIASITKIMTCLLAVESKKTNEIVVVDEIINESYGSGIYIEIGEELNIEPRLRPAKTGSVSQNTSRPIKPRNK